MDKEITKHYSNEDITIIWKPHVCIHSKRCWKELREVFDPSARPWINMKGATTERIREQVNNCPSGALSLKEISASTVNQAPIYPIIEVSPNGPLLVQGSVIIKDVTGKEKTIDKKTALCRCGHSSNKPYCDGAHGKNGFIG